MRCCFSRILNHLGPIVLTLLVAVPLSAQLNPAWQTTNSPDFSDLFQKSTDARIKPEIATIFDFSGSMQSLMYHPRFYNEDKFDYGDKSGFTFTLTGAKNSRNVSVTVGDGWYVGGSLVRPDGSLVTESNVDSTVYPTSAVLGGDKNLNKATDQSQDVRNWVRAASHVRFAKTVTANGSNVFRTIDIPIPWKVIDPASKAYPLGSLTVKDEYIDADGNSFGSKQDIEIDTRYRIETKFPNIGVRNENIILSGDSNKIVTTTKLMIRLNKDYIRWLFTGTYQNSDSTKPDYTEDTSLVGKCIVFDAADTLIAGGQTSVAQGQGFGTFGTETMNFWDVYAQRTVAKSVSLNAIPARDRVQAVKEAAIRTWINYQTRVFWAYRFLDGSGTESTAGTAGTYATTINNDSRTTISSTGVPIDYKVGGDTGWTLLNGNSPAGMKRLAALFPYTETPLCYAVARTLAQFTDPNTIFKDVETGDDAPLQCQKRFLIVFTDGVPTKDNKSEEKSLTPYLQSGTSGTANAGNKALLASKDNINPGNDWWNIFTYAGAAAHLGDTSRPTDILPENTMTVASYSASGSPSSYLPFTVNSRPSGASSTVTIPAPFRCVNTMTIGVSLGGRYIDAGSAKQRLFLTAVFGDTELTSWDYSKLKPFYLKDPSKPFDLLSNPRGSDSINFFDAATPDDIVKGLGAAFASTLAKDQTGATATPVIPWIGSGMGNQIYLASFKVPENGGPVWKGDLRMFPTKDVQKLDPTTGSLTQTQILDRNGVEVTDLATADQPGWSVLQAPRFNAWKDRKIYTRLESVSGTANPGTFSISTGITKTDLDDPAKPEYKLRALLPGSDTDTKLKNLQWMMGADIFADATGATTRGNILGDVIDSTPAFLEYASPSSSSMPSILSGAWTDGTKKGKHFRVIYVGTNQGVIHAFGEVTWDNNLGTATAPNIVKAGVVEELWAFIPTDIIKYCDYYQSPGNPHRAGVNGTPCLYFLDLPEASASNGDGMMSGASGTLERATLIMGLGKGGRSYYALDVRDPFSPKLGDGKGWALVPDEATSYVFDGTADNSVISTMGWSTCQPTTGRILVDSGAAQKLKDVAFLGGGFSVPEIEKNYPTPNSNTPLGRSVIALDVETGHVVKYWKLDASPDPVTKLPKNGPVGAGVMPMEVIPYSGLAQRAYFTDFFGGLWALGSRDMSSATGMSMFRVDSSNIGKWAASPRPVYHQDRPNGILSTMPAPFLVSDLRMTRANDPKVTPLAVGVALVSGDRNNPMDAYATGSDKPNQHRLTVVFDRQDSADLLGVDSTGILDANLKKIEAGMDSAVVTPGLSFYLNTYYGYFLDLPSRASGDAFVSKGITTPTVLLGKLYYSYFKPTGYQDNNACNPGVGTTTTVRVCDVMRPNIGTNSDTGCISGEVFTWKGVASGFSPKSVLTVLQGGMLAPADPSKKDELKIKSFDGQPAQALASPKVWRTVH